MHAPKQPRNTASKRLFPLVQAEAIRKTGYIVGRIVWAGDQGPLTHRRTPHAI